MLSRQVQVQPSAVARGFAMWKASLDVSKYPDPRRDTARMLCRVRTFRGSAKQSMTYSRQQSDHEWMSTHQLRTQNIVIPVKT